MIYYYFACGSIFLLALLLLTNAAKVNTAANRWLGIFFLFAGGAMLAWIAENTGLDKRYPFLIPLTELGRFVMAPALFISIRYFTALTPLPLKFICWHFLPAAIFPFLLFGGSAYLPAFFGMIVALGLRAQMLIYWIMSFYLLWKHQRHLNIIAADTSKINLKWLQWLLGGIGIMVLLWYNQIWQISTALILVTGFCYCIALYFITYAILQQREIFDYSTFEKIAIEEIFEEKPDAPRVKPHELKVLMEALTTLMSCEHLYRDSELNLPQLADKMGVSIHEVSWVLNKGYNKNFYQFINNYRVEAAKELLLNEECSHLSILGIAFEAGFNSKTTFNAAFKKITGMSPREFRQMQVRTDTDGH